MKDCRPPFLRFANEMYIDINELLTPEASIKFSLLSKKFQELFNNDPRTRVNRMLVSFIKFMNDAGNDSGRSKCSNAQKKNVQACLLRSVFVDMHSLTDAELPNQHRGYFYDELVNLIERFSLTKRSALMKAQSEAFIALPDVQERTVNRYEKFVNAFGAFGKDQDRVNGVNAQAKAFAALPEHERTFGRYLEVVENLDAISDPKQKAKGMIARSIAFAALPLCERTLQRYTNIKEPLSNLEWVMGCSPEGAL